jgi:DNA-binding XRE family transcriptional regulator
MLQTETTPAVTLSVSPERQAELYRELAKGTLTVPQTVRKVRNCTGLTIPQYATLVGVSKRYLGDIERGLMNPTITVLEKICAPLNLQVCLRPMDGAD